MYEVEPVWIGQQFEQEIEVAKGGGFLVCGINTATVDGLWEITPFTDDQSPPRVVETRGSTLLRFYKSAADVKSSSQK